MFKFSKDGITVSSILDTRREKQDGKFPVKIEVIYKRTQRYYPTGKTLSREQWKRLDSTKSTKLINVRESIENTYKQVRDIAEELAFNAQFSFEILNRRISNGANHSINKAFINRIEELRKENRIGNMAIYQNVLNNIEKFAGKEIPFNSLSVDWLRRFEAFLEGKSRTTISIHLRTLKAIVNRAIEDDIIKEAFSPFGKGRFEIKNGAGRKMALTMEQIGRIADYDDGTELTACYRDMWLFLYFCNGINMADLVQLKFRNIVEGEICYIRQKTKSTSKTEKEIRVILTEPMKAIIEKWGNYPAPENYIFPIIREGMSAVEIYQKKQLYTRAINKCMAKVGGTLGIGAISTYTARHSFATVLKRSGANIAYISESLGHSDLKTTENYLASFEKDERIKNADLLTAFLKQE